MHMGLCIAKSAVETSYSLQHQCCDTEQAMGGAVSFWIDELAQSSCFWWVVLESNE